MQSSRGDLTLEQRSEMLVNLQRNAADVVAVRCSLQRRRRTFPACNIGRVGSNAHCTNDSLGSSNLRVRLRSHPYMRGPDPAQALVASYSPHDRYQDLSFRPIPCQCLSPSRPTPLSSSSHPPLVSLSASLTKQTLAVHLPL